MDQSGQLELSAVITESGAYEISYWLLAKLLVISLALISGSAFLPSGLKSSLLLAHARLFGQYNYVGRVYLKLHRQNSDLIID